MLDSDIMTQHQKFLFWSPRTIRHFLFQFRSFHSSRARTHSLSLVLSSVPNLSLVFVFSHHTVVVAVF